MYKYITIHPIIVSNYNKPIRYGKNKIVLSLPLPSYLALYSSWHTYKAEKQNKIMIKISVHREEIKKLL